MTAMNSRNNASQASWTIGDGWLQLAVGVIILLSWEIGFFITKSNWISPPSAIVLRISRWLGGDLYVHLGTTLAELFIGLSIGAVAGVVMGLILGRAGFIAEILRPLIFAIYSVPLISLSPLFIMFFGMDMMPKIVLVALVVFFLIFFNTFSGAQSVDEELISAADLMGSNSVEKFRKVILPACLVWIIGGLNISLPYALVATITGEMLAARKGIGFMLSQSASQYDITGVYAILFILMILGLGLNEAMSRIEGWLLRWRPREG